MEATTNIAVKLIDVSTLGSENTLQVILEAYKFIDTCKDTDIKEAVFHSHQNGIYCC